MIFVMIGKGENRIDAHSKLFGGSLTVLRTCEYFKIYAEFSKWTICTPTSVETLANIFACVVAMNIAHLADIYYSEKLYLDIYIYFIWLF